MKRLALLIALPTIFTSPLGAQTVPPGMLYVASSQGTVYYWHECNNWRSLSTNNLVFYPSNAAARTDQKTPSAVQGCQGPADPPPAASTLDGAAMRAHFIDVGQGAATLLEFSCGAALIDTGGERATPYMHSDSVLIHYLRDFFDRRADLNNTLDLVLLTHPHSDHSAGMRDLFRAANGLTILNFVNNGENVGQNNDHEGAAGTTDFEVDMAGDPTTGITNAQIDPINCTGVGVTNPEFTVLWGEGGTFTSGNPNNLSAVTRIRFGASSIMITGDLEDDAIDDFLLHYQGTTELDIDVYVVGHHGAENGTTDALLQAMTPRLAIVQSGSRHRNGRSMSADAHGHPRRAAMNLLTGANGVTLTRPGAWIQQAITQTTWEGVCLTDAVYGTAWDGHIVIELRADGQITRPQPVAVC